MIVKVIGIPGGMGGIDPGVHPETLDRDQDHESSIAIGRLLEGGIAMIVVRGISGIATHGMGMGEEEDEQVEEEGGEEDTEIVVIEEGEGDTIAHPHLSRWTSNNNAASVVTRRVPIQRITAAMIVAGANPHLQLEPGSPGGRHCPEQVSRVKTSSGVISRSAVRKMVARKIWRWTRVTTRGVSPARGTELKTHPLDYPPSPLRSRKRCLLLPMERPIRSTRHRPAVSPPAHRHRNSVDPVESVDRGDRRDRL